MADIASLRRLREGPLFDGWDEFVEPEHVAASEACLGGLIDALIALGPEIPEDAARRAVDECVRGFNELDEDGWICTIEREDICDKIGGVVESCGFEFDEEWVSERDW